MEMDVSLRSYLEAQFKNVFQRLDRLEESAGREREQSEKRIAALEADVKVLDRTRPSTSQLLWALLAGIGSATTIATLIIQLLF